MLNHSLCWTTRFINHNTAVIHTPTLVTIPIRVGQPYESKVAMHVLWGRVIKIQKLFICHRWALGVSSSAVHWSQKSAIILKTSLLQSLFLAAAPRRWCMPMAKAVIFSYDKSRSIRSLGRKRVLVQNLFLNA